MNDDRQDGPVRQQAGFMMKDKQYKNKEKKQQVWFDLVSDQNLVFT